MSSTKPRRKKARKTRRSSRDIAAPSTPVRRRASESRAAPKRSSRGRPPRRAWTRYSDDELLDVRLCDLDLRLEGTWLEQPIAQLYEELGRRGIRLRPHFWLGEEFFSPEGVPGVSIPFYLAHPRLMKLERRQMYEVEGGNWDGCMKILRHEAGHAVQHGYNLHRRRRWQNTFGRSSQAYPEVYSPRPASKRFVLHLYLWYAQSHPDEDFAETFAVWLRPRPVWRRRYKGWPALKKLEYVDALMKEIAGTPAPVRTRRRVESLPTLRKTLREYYAEKHARYGTTYPEIYDRDLTRLFSYDDRHRRNETASAFLRRNRAQIRRMVCKWTGEYQFSLDQVFSDMIGRCRELSLHVHGSQRQLILDFAILLTLRTMQSIYSRRDWHPI